jgi:hypothetical protein
VTVTCSSSGDFSVPESRVHANFWTRPDDNAVSGDREAHTLIWPNGADFDPAILHDWPDHDAGMLALARRWASAGRGKKAQ